jgi:hypothetical protein
MLSTPFEEMLETMGRFNEEMIRAGVLVAAEGPPGPDEAQRTVEAVRRIESARIVAALVRYTGDFEDVAQEPLAEALVSWSRDGAPAHPVGWLLATARRRAIDSSPRPSSAPPGQGRMVLRRGPHLAWRWRTGGGNAKKVSTPRQLGRTAL